MRSPVPARRLWLIALGFSIWSAGFIALYGLNGAGCAYGWPPAFQRGLLIVIFVCTVAGLGGLTFWTFRRHRVREGEDAPRPASSIELLGYGASAAALGATVLNFAPVLFASMCV